jgi:hypothetical protein
VISTGNPFRTMKDFSLRPARLSMPLSLLTALLFAAISLSAPVTSAQSSVNWCDYVRIDYDGESNVPPLTANIIVAGTPGGFSGNVPSTIGVSNGEFVESVTIQPFSWIIPIDATESNPSTFRYTPELGADVCFKAYWTYEIVNIGTTTCKLRILVIEEVPCPVYCCNSFSVSFLQTGYDAATGCCEFAVKATQTPAIGCYSAASVEIIPDGTGVSVVSTESIIGPLSNTPIGTVRVCSSATEGASFRFKFKNTNLDVICEKQAGTICTFDPSDCCEGLSVNLVSTGNTYGQWFDFDVVLDRSSTSMCSGANISIVPGDRMAVLSQTVTSESTPFDETVVGRVRWTRPNVLGGVFTSTVRIELKDASGNVICTVEDTVTFDFNPPIE